MGRLVEPRETARPVCIIPRSLLAKVTDLQQNIEDFKSIMHPTTTVWCDQYRYACTQHAAGAFGAATARLLI